MRPFRRTALSLVLAAPLAAGLPGCASTGVKNPFAATAKKNDVAAATKPAETVSAKPDAAAAKGGKSRQFDQETLALIERELRDASPDERDALYNELKSVPPEMVREVLRIRRMGLNFREQQRLAERGAASPDVDPTSSADPTLAETADRRASDPGLGENPWSIDARRTVARPALGGHSTAQFASSEPVEKPVATQVSASMAAPPPAVSPAPHPETIAAVQPPATPGGTPVAPIPTVPPADPDANAAPAVTPAAAQASPSPAAAPQPAAPAVPGQPPTNPAPVAQPAEGRPLETAPLPQFAEAGGDLVPGQYAAGAPLPGGFGQPVVANVQKAWQEIPKPKLPWGQSPPAAPVTQASATQPASARVSAGTSAALAQAISELEAEVARLKPGSTPEEMRVYVEKHVHLRLLYLLTGQQERSVQAIPGIPPADQEFWQQALWGMSNYFDTTHLPREADRATQTVAQMAVAISRLKQKAALEVRNLCFCQRINSFGSYERFDRDEFTAGQPVLLYAEIENFHSEPTAEGQYRTLLKSTLEIYRPGKNGELIDRHEFPATEDLCRNPRRDYFHSYEFTIPTKLALGPHVLKLTVEDQLTRRVVSQSTRFTVK